jgi:hypothetical protein
VNIAIAPRGNSHKTRTSEPSAAITSGFGLIHLLGNPVEDILARLHPREQSIRGHHAIHVAQSHRR